MKSFFLADGENHVRAALQLLIEYQPEMKVVGESDNTENLLAQVCAKSPDVILFDWNLPGIRPHNLIQTLRGHCPKTLLVAISVKPEQELAAMELGVDGFLLKQLSPESFIENLELIISKSK